MADTVRRAEYFYTTLQDRAGEGARVLEALRKAGVNLRAVHAFPSDRGKTQVDFFPENAAAFEKAAKSAGVSLSAKKTAFLVEGDDRAGAARELLAKLGDAGINVTALDAVRCGGRFGAIIWVKPADLDKAGKALGAS